MADVKIPGVKKPVNRFVVIGVAVGGAAAAYAVWKKRQSSSAASSSAASGSTVTDPSSGIAYPADAQDPVTGETYAQEIGQYGSVEAADSAASTSQASSLYSQGDLYGTGYGVSEYDSSGYGSTTTVSGSVYTSNAAWAQAATAGLTDIGYTGSQVASALGLYLTGAPVTTDQAAIINAAIAEYGSPPVGSFQVTVLPGGGTGTGISGKQVSGLKVDKVNAATRGSNGSVQISWNQLPGATSYKVFMSSKGTFTTDRTIANEGSLSPGHHEVMVTPEPGGKGRSVSFTVRKAHDWRA